MNFEELLARFVDWAIVTGKKLLMRPSYIMDSMKVSMASS